MDVVNYGLFKPSDAIGNDLERTQLGFLSQILKEMGSNTKREMIKRFAAWKFPAPCGKVGKDIPSNIEIADSYSYGTFSKLSSPRPFPNFSVAHNIADHHFLSYDKKNLINS